mmetsp:Transcript_63999/g.113833  ORF Transcript_63999/g.113833 Transcript_63999/m.113833 type:complete len:298 (-) Transcript_63999:116-1009(-)|eukprot:CAMPEP_0197664648 /NCGR_PEP_ID=MMETSP1338-20131121/58766_1 /TAXON_ID=43686 ORGANISM="Pelagodinium beii, Strain RCC1491" /NCGR_SAMPLE_ID=MMETSP1338 /ASSEMBLY_ACC=CAM_ASM_000754 /LENGTH=297 /DNA_ID=CAMNT_0043243335 /DNA_START=34 /DNA_END=927 /DNA_ORIENTATION=-
MPLQCSGPCFTTALVFPVATLQRSLRELPEPLAAASLISGTSRSSSASSLLTGTVIAFCATSFALQMERRRRKAGKGASKALRPRFVCRRAAEEVVGRAGLLRSLKWQIPFLGRRERTSSSGGSTTTLEKADVGGTSPEEELALLSKTGPMRVAMLGTRECPYQHQQEIELLSEARVSRGDHIFTSGSSGTNSSVIRGALRAQRPKLLTVVLPQSFEKQSKESQALLKKCLDSGADLCPMPMNDNLPLAEAAAVCNTHVLERVDRLIAFASHESSVYLSLIDEAKEKGVLATAFFMD